MQNSYSWVESFPVGFLVGARCLLALCHPCLVTLTLQPSPAMRPSGSFPESSSPVYCYPVAPKRLKAVSAANKLRRKVQRFRRPRNQRGGWEGGAAGPAWGWEFSTVSLDAQRNGQVHRSREISFWSRKMGLASVLSVIQARRQASVYFTLRISCSTSPLVQAAGGGV